MADRSLQNPHLADLLEQIEGINIKINALAGSLNEEQLRKQPPDGGWSIGMVIEHLIVSAHEYFLIIKPILEKKKDQPRLDQYVWKPSRMGKILINSIKPEATRKIKAPGLFTPSLEPREQVVSEFLKYQKELTTLISQSDGLNLRRIKLGSPVSWLIRLNLGDCYTILVVHMQRHLLQIERLINALPVSPQQGDAE